MWKRRVANPSPKDVAKTLFFSAIDSGDTIKAREAMRVIGDKIGEISEEVLRYAEIDRSACSRMFLKTGRVQYRQQSQACYQIGEMIRDKLKEDKLTLPKLSEEIHQEQTPQQLARQENLQQEVHFPKLLLADCMPRLIGNLEDRRSSLDLRRQSIHNEEMARLVQPVVRRERLFLSDDSIARQRARMYNSSLERSPRDRGSL